MGGALPPARRGPLLALSPRGQALQGKQKSVVNTVPNPKWLLPNGNPIKARLVYLSSSGLFIAVQMAATFGRLSRSLPAARHAKLSSTESGPAPVPGHEPRPPGHVGSSVPLLPRTHALHRPPPTTSAGSGSPLHRASSQVGPAWYGYPNNVEEAGAPRREEKVPRSPCGEQKGRPRTMGEHSAPRVPGARQLRIRRGPCGAPPAMGVEGRGSLGRSRAGYAVKPPSEQPPGMHITGGARGITSSPGLVILTTGPAS